MRTRSMTLALVLTALVSLAACSEAPVAPEGSGQALEPTLSILPPTADLCGDVLEAALLAGQDLDIGTVTVANDADFLYVAYATVDGWKLRATHLQVAPSLDGVPTNGAGNPVVGQFDLQDIHDDVAEHTYAVPLSELGVEAGDDLVIAAHADVYQVSTVRSETAWGDGARFVEKDGNWATYSTATVQDCGGTLEGTVVHALTGDGIEGATVDFGPDGSATTGADGSFSLRLPEGTREGTVSADGFISSSISVSIAVGETTTEVVALSPEVGADEVRIVLTWGSDPTDLDAHLTGPISGSTSRFHVYFNSSGSLSSSPYAELDRDDVSSFGPETITIAQRFDGTYRYSVHDFTNRLSTSSRGLAESGARIKVFQGDAEVATFTPPDQDGTLWTVFEMDGLTGTITPVGAMGYTSSPTDPAFSISASLQAAGGEGTDAETDVHVIGRAVDRGK